ncbi:MAG: carboxymuconolactone decarboxylase family protein [Deltaproteobacteria bacterium]|nr:carboxymuconolactone decarboxylase family protein [Deltaproteobacteria bacterium]
MARVPEIDPAATGAQTMCDSLVTAALRALARSPALPQGVSALGQALRDGLSLDPQLCELAVLQLFRLTHCDVGFRQRMAVAKVAGLSDKQIANVGAYRTYAYYDDRERLVLEYAEVVTRAVAVPDELFARIRAHFNEREIVELTMVIAYWNMLARLLVPLQLEPAGEGLRREAERSK